MPTKNSLANLKANAGKGRPKGSINKTTAAVKDMVVAALDKAGGITYLLEQAEANPTAFLTLVGKVIPLQLAGDVENPIQHCVKIELVSGTR